MERHRALQDWLGQLGGLEVGSLRPASSDASFRRYFRIARQSPRQDSTCIVMDAPPPQEDCRPFVTVARLLREHGVRAPEVLAADLERGFLLLEDFGPHTLLDHLHRLAAQPAGTAVVPRGADAEACYRRALSDLCRLQQIAARTLLPAYDAARLRQEMALFPEWYLHRHLQQPLDAAEQAVWEHSVEAVLQVCTAQAQVLVHRDYHSRNLMLCTDAASGAWQLGVLDFQDAVVGPITYDAVSLLRDAYIDHPEPQQIDWLVRQWSEARQLGLPVPADFGDYYRDFEWMGVQRHLKVLGIFARLFHRDGKAGYLDSMPRVLRALQASCERYNALRPLGRLVAARHAPLQDGLTF